MIDFFRTFSQNIEHYLLIAIGTFFVFAIVLFSLIIVSRLQKVRKEKLTERYNVIIKKILFSVLFEEKKFSDFESTSLYIPLFRDDFFRELLIKEAIVLHKSFEAGTVEDLETFYFQSHLIKDSFKKLKSRKWEVKCQGIEELAEMNVSKVFDVLIKISKTKHKTLKLIALKACIKLNGTNGLLHLVDHVDPIDEWVQLSIIESIKKRDIQDTQGVEKLFQSKNKSVVMLGVKITKSLNLTKNLGPMKTLLHVTKEGILLNKLEESISYLEVNNNV